jgi:hypothetical protein
MSSQDVSLCAIAVNELVLQGADLDASRIPDSFGEGFDF